MTYYSLRRKYFRTLSNFLIISGFVLIFLSFGPVVKDEMWFYFKELKSQETILSNNTSQNEESVFAKFLSSKPILIEPVNKDFSLVIERIGVNAPVVKDVRVTDQKSYIDALKSGVAHAISTGYPSPNPGNVYIFAHSSVDFWKLGKYSTVFNLLRKLDNGDIVHVFYDQKDFVYEVVNKQVYDGWNTYPITRPVIEPILTLQTCDPPGTTINRLVVTAKLKEVK